MTERLKTPANDGRAGTPANDEPPEAPANDGQAGTPANDEPPEAPASDGPAGGPSAGGRLALAACQVI